MRNSGTGSNQLAGLLRDASEHLVLLTATPIQTYSQNLYELLKLISPEDFYDQFSFQEMLEANKPIIRALRLIWNASSNSKHNISQAKEEIENALESSYFQNSLRLNQIKEALENNDFLPTEKQVQYAQTLESSSLFGQYMTRTRKSDVMKRVKREAIPLEVHFSEVEKQIYEQVTQTIREKAQGQQGVAIFSLIMRQRQMASCMVAALESWKRQDRLSEFFDPLQFDNVEIDDTEFFWEDFGKCFPDNGEMQRVESDLSFSFNYDSYIEQLKKNDTKYHELIKILKYRLEQNAKEKFVLFAYFKPTLRYLKERLEQDGINTCLIQGGMNRQDKQDTLYEFKNNANISVLLSSEVGSEGIDLEFCQVLINYDLPWNPMRVEQRIGRLDRIGQQAEKILIINFNLVDTIEERILERLYNRIGIFKESIGDLEEILGEKTEELLIKLMGSTLTEQERKELEEQTTKALQNEIEQQRQLEKDAINSVAFSDYIFHSINQSRNQGRWLQAEEVERFVKDYFQLQYPGTIIESKGHKPHIYDISLSEEAKRDLKLFCQKNQNKLSVSTLLHLPNRTVTCLFDPKLSDQINRSYWELINPNHPLIKWIVNQYESEQQSVNPVASIQLRYRDVQDEINENSLSTGTYVYIVQLWTLKGLRQENKLVYKAFHLDSQITLSNDLAEQLIHAASVKGEPKPNTNNIINNFEEVLQAYDNCDETLKDEFFEASENFESENEDLCHFQQGIAERSSQRKIQEIEDRIQRFQQEGKTKIIPALQGKIDKEKQTLQVKLANIQEKRKTETNQPILAAGLIFVEAE